MICKYCHKLFTPKYKTQRFCSQNCSRVYTAKQMIKFPQLQNKEWLEDQYYNKRKSMKQISKEIGCGETRVYTKMDEFGITRRKISEALTGLPKSDEHTEKIRARMVNRWRGENNPRWKGGIYRKSLEPRFNGEYVSWRKKVKLKYRNHCVECNRLLGVICKCCDQKIQFHVHHIKSVIKYPNLIFDVNNGILLCYSCHQKKHQ